MRFGKQKRLDGEEGGFLGLGPEIASVTITFITCPNTDMDAACDRKQYRRVIGNLFNLAAYPGGQKAAKELAEYWHIYHRNRPAMKNELLQAGYVISGEGGSILEMSKDELLALLE